MELPGRRRRGRPQRRFMDVVKVDMEMHCSRLLSQDWLVVNSRRICGQLVCKNHYPILVQAGTPPSNRSAARSPVLPNLNAGKAGLSIIRVENKNTLDGFSTVKGIPRAANEFSHSREKGRGARRASVRNPGLVFVRFGPVFWTDISFSPIEYLKRALTRERTLKDCQSKDFGEGFSPLGVSKKKKGFGFSSRSLVAQSEEQGSRKTTHGPLGLVADIPNIQQHGMLQQGSEGLLLTSHWLCS
ncbi:hypothetical protein SRHO_G00215000 [Serrasalmus rhombeus]